MSAGPRTPFENPVVEWIDSRLPLFTMVNKEYGVFPTPKNFNYFWNFGAIAMFMLVTMIVTGITLAMHYAASTGLAFDSVERIMRDVNYGWLLRYIHMNGASFFFIAVYTHIFRGMYYGSYKAPRELLWIFGVVIFLLMMATAFMGYVLPWGQMSFWGATVITNLFSAIPVVGFRTSRSRGRLRFRRCPRRRQLCPARTRWASSARPPGRRSPPRCGPGRRLPRGSPRRS